MGYLPSFREPRLPGQGVWLDAEALLVDLQTPYQHVQVVRTTAFGTTLVLDGLFQISERDEEFYHEPLVHPAMLAADKPRDVLIVGGGDGGAIHQVLQYPDITSCTLVEIDADVIRVSKEYLGRVHRGSFDDPRVNVVVADAHDYLDSEENCRDVIILDVTDPVGPCEKLFSAEFMRKVARTLRPGGFATVHLGFPLCWPEASTRCYEAVRTVMQSLWVYSAFVPLYGTVMAFALMSPERCPPGFLLNLPRRLESRGPGGLEILNSETLLNMFALSPRLQRVFPT
jgi:spermidine synthase